MIGVFDLIRINRFQELCSRDVDSLLDEGGLDYSRNLVEGDSESYMVYKVGGGERIEVYIYEDEAGFYFGDDWYVFEAQDYPSLDLLRRSFFERLKGRVLSL
ncbi:MAG: hypothetical protein AAF604_17630 [Acidobacteriota bacterium]